MRLTSAYRRVMPFDDLTFAAEAGWGELMRLARAFPLETFAGVPRAEACAATPCQVDLPRQMNCEPVQRLVDAAGDGPLIGLGI